MSGTTRTAVRGQAPRQLHAALAAIERGDVHHAHLMATRATAALQDLIDRLALQDAEANRRHAIKVAKSMTDARGRRRAPATMPGYNKGRPNVNKGVTFGYSPPSTNEVLRCYAVAPSVHKNLHGACETCGTGPRERHAAGCINPFGERFRAAFMLDWRTGMRAGCELLRLQPHDLHFEEGYVHVAKGKGSFQRDIFTDQWLWPLLEPWLAFRAHLPAGPLFCVLDGPTAGRRGWDIRNFRRELHQVAGLAGVARRLAPHQLRHAFACECIIDGVPMEVLQRQLGHKSLATTAIYIQALPVSVFKNAMHSRPMPQIGMLDAIRNEGVSLDRQGVPVAPARTADAAPSTPDLMGALARAQEFTRSHAGQPTPRPARRIAA